MEPPYKRGALWDPVDLFDIIIPRQSKGQAKFKLPRLEQVEVVTCVTINHSFLNIQSPCSRGLIYIDNRVETNKWTKTR